jgi:uncharacterized membrane protein
VSYDSPPPPPPPQYGAPPPGMPGEQKTSGKAIGSLVTGIIGAFTFCCGFLVVPSIAAVVLGLLARRDIANSNGQLKGDGMALAGIIAGIVGLIGFVVLIILVATGTLDTTFDFETS